MTKTEIPFSFIVVLLHGTDMEDKNVYHYIAIKEDYIESFSNVIRGNKPYDLKDYGVVLHSGYNKPDNETKERMEKLYGCNHDSLVTFGQ